MLIGIDASRATLARRTGTENYALHLIRGLLALGQGHHFRLYFNQAPAPGLLPTSAEQRIMPFPRLWTHARLSSEMLAQPPDVLFVPSHVLPLVHPPRSVVTVHDLGFLYYPDAHTLFQNLYLRWSTRYNARSAAGKVGHVLADSQATRQDLIRHYGIPRERITVVYPGWDESLAPVGDPDLQAGVRARYGLGERYLLYVGTLHPRKNLVRLIEAFAQLCASPPATPEGGKRSGTDLRLVLAGKRGWLYDDILARVRRLGLTDRVLLTGYVPDSDLAALLSGAQAFVFPSLYEGFGFPVLEAMACGTPVVCSTASSLPEVAGDAAVMVDPLDPEALAAALYRIVEEPGLRRDLRKRGFRQVRRFSWRRCAEETLQVLESVGQAPEE
jgi:glycosyltransferase involved in cell wall biosynthesis